MSASYRDTQAAEERVANMIANVNEVWRAIDNEGPHPNHHRLTMLRHRAEWPTLWAALDRLTGRVQP